MPGSQRGLEELQPIWVSIWVKRSASPPFHSPAQLPSRWHVQHSTGADVTPHIPSQTSCPQIKHPVWPTESLRRHRQSDAPFPRVCGLPVSTGAKPSGPAARAETQCGFAISELGPLRTRSAAERARLERDREVRRGERNTVERGE